MKKTLLLLTCCLLSLSMFAQEDDGRLRIAVFDPASSGTSIDEGTKIAVRELISSTIVNTGKYNLVERSLLEKVMQEQKFSNSGAVDDMQATEVGKLAGANKIVLSVVTLAGGRNMLSIKIIDVKTASVDRQKVKMITSGEMLDAVEPLTLEMLDLAAPGSSTSSSATHASASNAGDRNQTKVGAVISNVFTRKDSNVPSSTDVRNSTSNNIAGNTAAPVYSFADTDIPPDGGFVFYGVDYSAVKICDAAESNSQFAKAFGEINYLISKEWNKFNLGRLINRDVVAYPKPAADRAQYLEWGGVRTVYGTPQKKPLQAMIDAYDIPNKSGVGIVLIAWVLNKKKGIAVYEVVMFDVATRRILFSYEAEAEVGGSGLRNYWANTVYNLTKNKKLGKQMSLAL